MNKSFDQKVRDAIRKEDISVPEHIHQSTEALLASLPEKEGVQTKAHINFRPVRRIIAAAACFLFVVLVALPNVSVTYAKAVENIPIIGDLVEIFTIRNYFYSDERHELDAKIPEVNDPYHTQASDLINMNVDELTGEVIHRFYDNLEITHDKGYGSIHIDYETITNTDKWFTLKLTVSEIQASSNTCFRFYHIDRVHGTYVSFGDLFDSKDFDAIEQIIRTQMEAEMAVDSEVVYWTEDTELGQSITALNAEQNFYFDDSGNLVIVYNQYEVSPGSMGCPQFELLPEEYMEYMNQHIAELFGQE